MSRYIPHVIGAALVLALVGALIAYAGASAEARLLHDQLEDARDSIVVAHEERELAMAATDSVMALSDSLEAAADSAISEVQDESDQAEASSDAALAEALAAAEGMPAVQVALATLETELVAERAARQEERAVTATELFASQMQVRTLTTALLNERTASTTEIFRLNAALSISMQESDAWQRAAKPGVLRQVWQQGRVAVVVAAVILAVR